MRRRKRPFWLLIISLLSFAGLIYLILNFAPTHKFTIYSPRFGEAGNFQLSIVPIFFIIVFLLTFSFAAYILNNSRRALFLALFIVSYLLLRLFNLTQISFLILLLAFFIALEFFFSHKH